MKIKKKKGQTRDLVILGSMCYDQQVLQAVQLWHQIHQEDLFLNKAFNRIANWCIAHYTKKGTAPGAKILHTKYFEPWEEEVQGSDEAVLVGEVLNNVVGAWKQVDFQRDQLFDLAEDVLRRQQVLIASDRVGGSSSAKTIDEIMAGAVPVTLAREPVYDNLFDNPEIARDVDKMMEPVFTFSNQIVTDFFEDTFAAGTFTTFLAPEKRGKSQWLLECVMSALGANKRVLYFDAGDMTEDQIFLRFVARSLKRPYKAQDQYVLTEPLDIVDNELTYDITKVTHDTRVSQQQADKVKRKCSRIFKERLFSRNFPRGSLSCSIIRTILDTLSMRGVHIDVVVVDYADILRPEKSKYSDNRHAITEIWGDMRTISMSYNVALITATQSDAATYENEIGQSSFSESKTKNAFITAEIGIDKTEYHESIFKMKYVFRRAGSISNAIYVMSDLSTYRPAMSAMWVPTANRSSSKKKNGRASFGSRDRE